MRISFASISNMKLPSAVPNLLWIMIRLTDRA